MSLWIPTCGGFIHLKQDYDSWDETTRNRIANQYAAWAIRAGGVVVSCDALSRHLPTGLYAQTYDLLQMRPGQSSWWTGDIGHFKRGYHDSFYDPGEDPDAEIDWADAGVWLQYVEGPSAGQYWWWMDSGFAEYMPCMESRACIIANIRRIIGLVNWANAPGSMHGQGSRKYDLLCDLWFPITTTSEWQTYGMPGPMPLVGGAGDYWCGRTETPLHGVAGHDVQSINGVHRVNVGFVVFWSLLIQVCHAFGYSLNAGLWEWDPRKIRQILDGIPDFDSVHGEEGTDPISIRLYVNPRGATSGSWETFYPKRMMAVPDVCWEELSLLRGSWQTCGEAGFFGQQAGTWGDVDDWQALMNDYRPDIVAAYHPSQYLRFSLGSTLSAEQVGLCPEHPRAYIASGAIAAKYRCGVRIHHIGAQDPAKKLFGVQVPEHSLGAELAMLIPYWDDLAGIADDDRVLDPPDPATWGGCNSLNYYVAENQGRPWSFISQAIVGTHYWNDPYQIWVTWQDVNATWTLGAGVAVDPTRNVELVLVPTTGDDRDCYMWQSRVAWDGLEVPGNDAGRNHVWLDASTGILRLSDAGKLFHSGCLGRVGYKIPIVVDGSGGGDEDTIPPHLYDFRPYYGQPDVPTTSDLRVKTLEAGSGLSTVTCALDGVSLLTSIEYVAPGIHEVVAEPPGGMTAGPHQADWQATDYAGNTAGASVAFTVIDAPPEAPVPPVPADFHLVYVVWNPVSQTGTAGFAWDPPAADAVRVDGYFMLDRQTPFTSLPGHWLSVEPTVGTQIPPGSGNVCVWTGTAAQYSALVTGQAAGPHYVACFSWRSDV